MPPCSGLHEVDSQPASTLSLYAILNSSGIFISPLLNFNPSLSPNWFIGSHTSFTCSAQPSVNIDKNSLSNSE